MKISLEHILMMDESQNHLQDSSVSGSGSGSSSDVNSDDLSSDSDLFGDEEEEEEQEDNLSPSSGSSHGDEPLQNMSTLLQELPFKRGLSKHYNGKSQSFTSLSNVSTLEDLAKPENPFNKKLKSCRSYGGLFLEGFNKTSQNQPQRSSSSSRSGVLKKSSSRGSCLSLSSRRNNNGSFLGNRPPTVVPPHRSASTSDFANQTPLLA